MMKKVTSSARLMVASTFLLGATVAGAFAASSDGFSGFGFGSKGGAISRFVEIDKNNDNQISLDEFLNEASGRFERADADADGAVTWDEARTAIEKRFEERRFLKRAKGRHAPERITTRLFEGFDLNEDGTITQAEQRSRLSKLFALADRNDDTFVDAREVEKAMRFFKQHKKGRHGRGHGRGHHGGGRGE